MEKILVTVDFDDTVSPINHDYDFGEDTEYSVFDFGFPCAVRNSVLSFLNELKQSPNVDTVWVSSWVEMTEMFNKKSGKKIPDFGWLPVSGSVSKAESIYKYAIENKYTKVCVFEDDTKVRSQLKRLIEQDGNHIEMVFFMCKKKVGITDRMINRFWAGLL